MDKKYYLFAFYQYYPRGGWNDFIESFDNLDDVFKSLDELEFDFAHVVHYGKVVKEFYRGQEYSEEDEKMGLVGKWVIMR